MLLAHKPVLFPMSPPSSHRRHPSAPPAVVVQPTKVPGILSISKPLRADSPRQHHGHNHSRHPHRSPKAKQAQPSTRTTQDDPVKFTQEKPTSDSLLPPVVEKPVPHPPPATLDRPPRGRQSKAPKDKAATRNSSTHGHSRRNNARQPSPPIHSSRVEGPLSLAQTLSHHNSNPTANSFDPFIVSSDSDSDLNPRPPFPSNSRSAKPPPTLASPPSGKAVRRRQNVTQAPVTPSPAPRPVPVPGDKQSSHRHNISRSAPNFQMLPPIDKRRASTGYAVDTEFPVCDDTTDVEDHSPPSTPSREPFTDKTWQHLSLDAPRMAPISFSFATTMDATPSRTRHHHRRTPSEGVFNLSMDEDMSSTPNASEELKKLFGFPPKRFSSVGPSATRTGKDKSGFFASSVFQNSPSPDELPPPAF